MLDQCLQAHWSCWTKIQEMIRDGVEELGNVSDLHSSPAVRDMTFVFPLAIY